MGLIKSQLIGLRDYIRGYKVITGTISQGLTNAPVITIFENTIGSIKGLYNNTGSFSIVPTDDVSPIFPEFQTMFFISNTYKGDTWPVITCIGWADVNNLTIKTNLPDGTPVNGYLNENSFEIRVKI